MTAGLESFYDWLVATIAAIEEMEKDDDMKVTIAQNGDVSFDTDDVAAAAAFVRELSAEPESRPPAPPMTPLLTPALADTHRELVAAADDGLTPAEVAAIFGIAGPSAGARLAKLVEKGLAVKVGRGLYKAAP